MDYDVLLRSAPFFKSYKGRYVLAVNSERCPRYQNVLVRSELFQKFTATVTWRAIIGPLFPIFGAILLFVGWPDLTM